MSRRIGDIDKRVLELEKLREIEEARERRFLAVEERLYSAEEEATRGSLAALLESTGVSMDVVERLFEEQSASAERRIGAAYDLLQLNEEEIDQIADVERAIRLIDPCAWVHSSPGWMCVWNAAATACSHVASPGSTADCSCTVANNECNAKVKAAGSGVSEWRYANADSYLYFDVPARPSPATVFVQAFVPVHGFYVLDRTLGSVSLTLDLEMKGYQYGYSWATNTESVLNLSSTTMGRHDDNHFLSFTMPIGADPFSVRVGVKLRARAKKGGSVAVGDFATGAGNYFKTVWVNTHTP